MKKFLGVSEYFLQRYFDQFEHWSYLVPEDVISNVINLTSWKWSGVVTCLFSTIVDKYGQSFETVDLTSSFTITQIIKQLTRQKAQVKDEYM